MQPSKDGLNASLLALEVVGIAIEQAFNAVNILSLLNICYVVLPFPTSKVYCNYCKNIHITIYCTYISIYHKDYKGFCCSF